MLEADLLSALGARFNIQKFKVQGRNCADPVHCDRNTLAFEP
jgi:hypothetical protein